MLWTPAKRLPCEQVNSKSARQSLGSDIPQTLLPKFIGSIYTLEFDINVKKKTQQLNVREHKKKNSNKNHYHSQKYIEKTLNWIWKFLLQSVLKWKTRFTYTCLWYMGTLSRCGLLQNYLIWWHNKIISFVLSCIKPCRMSANTTSYPYTNVHLKVSVKMLISLKLPLCAACAPPLRSTKITLNVYIQE